MNLKDAKQYQRECNEEGSPGPLVMLHIDEYVKLLRDQHVLILLKVGGVEHWDGFEESLQAFWDEEDTED